jgi:hypothetical protein
MLNVERADHAVRATVIREARRSQRRSASLANALTDPTLFRFLAEVDSRWPGLVDVERLRLAKILHSLAGSQTRVRQLLTGVHA